MAALFLSVAEVAERWGASQGFVRQRVTSGEIAAHRFGRSVRVRMDAVEAFEAGCVAPPSNPAAPASNPAAPALPAPFPGAAAARARRIARVLSAH